MSGSELSAIFRLEFYKKQCKWASQPANRISQREGPEADAPALAASTPPRRQRSRPSSAQSHSSSQLNTTYSVEGASEDDAPGTEPLPRPRFVDDFVDSWVHAASSCGARDADTDGLHALEPEPAFCVGAAGAPHSSELNLYRPPTPASPTRPQPDSCTPYNIDIVESDESYVPKIPAECDVSRPPPPLPPPLAPSRSPLPPSIVPGPSALCSNICAPDPTQNMRREWDLDKLAAAADAELRAAAAHAQRHRSLVTLCHRLAPRHYLPSSAVLCCPLCGSRTDARSFDAPAPPARGRGHLPQIAAAVPMDVGQWARVQSVAMVARYP